MSVISKSNGEATSKQYTRAGSLKYMSEATTTAVSTATAGDANTNVHL